MPVKRAVPLVGMAVLLFALPAHAGEIHDAARDGDLATVQKLLANSSATINAKDQHERTALHWACRGVHPEVARVLIEGGADVNAKDKNLITPLHSVAARGHRDVAELLIDHGAIVDSPDYEEQTALHYAAIRGHADVAALLVARGASLEARNGYGRTPLLLAARESGDPAVARILIDAGADIDAEDRSGETSLELAAWRGFSEFIDILMDEGAEVPLEGDDAKWLLQFAACRALDRLFDHMAASGADLSTRTEHGGSLLHSAAEGGSQRIVSTLLAQGMDINERDNFGWAPLHYAAELGGAGIVEFLAGKGADIDARTASGKTPLNVARQLDRREVEAALVSLGADISPPRFPVLEGPYLGQEPPGREPKVFAPGIVSSKHRSHSSIAFSPDGKEAYWTPMFRRSEAGYGYGTVYYTRMVGNRWTLPEVAPFSREEENRCDVPFFSPDGNRLYFISRRPLEPGGSSTGERIWYVERQGEGWSEVKLLDTPANDMDIHWQFSLDSEGNLYFGGSSGQDIGGGDIYVSRFVDGRYLEPENLGPNVNSEESDFSPFIAPDGSYLILTRISGTGPDDLYICFRKQDGTWTEARAMGPAMNDPGNKLCPLVCPDGKYLFYLGAREGIDGICWVSAGVIERLRKEALK